MTVALAQVRLYRHEKNSYIYNSHFKYDIEKTYLYNSLGWWCLLLLVLTNDFTPNYTNLEKTLDPINNLNPKVSRKIEM